jgi:hypothetical protein
MTTIRLTKSGQSDLTIFAGKVEETSNKELISWPDSIVRPDWPSTPTTTTPGRESVDILYIQREFTITGFIDKDSTSAGNVLSARDTLNNMQRTGGPLIFKYGVSSELPGSGYTSSSNNGYYNNGFSCHVTRIMIVETPAAADVGVYSAPAQGNIPELFEVVIVLICATENTDL